MKKKILIFGYTGNLGSNFIHFLEKKYNFYLFSNKNKKFIKNAKYINLKLYQSLSDHEILDTEIKKINPEKNCVIGFGITEKTISNFKNTDGLVVGSQICKEITRCLNNRQNPVTNVSKMVSKLRKKIS